MHVYENENIIAGMIKYQKNKAWAKFGEGNLLGLVRKDGGIDYICVSGDTGIQIFREEEIYSFNVLVDFDASHDVSFESTADEDFTAEEETRYHMLSYIDIALDRKEESSPSWVRTIDRYKRKMGIEIYGWDNYFSVTKLVPRRAFLSEVNKEDQKRVLSAIRLLNYLAFHPECIKTFGREELPDGTSRQKVVLYKPQKGGSYDTSIIYIPEERQFPFESLPFEDETLARQIRSLVSQSKDVMECNLFLTRKPILEEGFEMAAESHNPDLIGNHLMWPWTFIAGTPKDKQMFFINAFQSMDGKELRKLAQTMIISQLAPYEIRVSNEWTYRYLKDFCKKTGIVLSRASDLWIEDESAGFLDYEDDDKWGKEVEEDFNKIISGLRFMSDEELEKLPAIILDVLHTNDSELPSDLRKRFTRLFKW